MQQIAQQLNNPSSVVAVAIDGTANEITAAITKITGDQPSSVANSAAIVAAAKKLGA
jgi:phenylpyruvate tautomerase PptA (4-oxalocrotonate tautomerase family)